MEGDSRVLRPELVVFEHNFIFHSAIVNQVSQKSSLIVLLQDRETKFGIFPSTIGNNAKRTRVFGIGDCQLPCS